MSHCLEDICINKCQALCCYNGAAVTEDEAQAITALVHERPHLFPGVPAEFLVSGPVESSSPGTVGHRTALREHRHFPDHVEVPEGFTNTTCVFTAKDGRCMLHGAALELGLPVSSAKPYECRIFPMMVIEGELIAPVDELGETPEYAAQKGYHMELMEYIPCVRHKPANLSWAEFAGVPEDRESR